LERGKVKTVAKSGDIAAMDVVIPEGSTGQPPGPIISQLNAVGLPTRIESGSVWVSKDTLVVRKGESISERLAALLSKLGIKAVEAGLSMKAVLDEGLIISGDMLKIDVEATRRSLEQGNSEAFALSLSVAYPTLDNIAMLLQIAQKEAFTLSLNAAVPTKETIADLVRKAHAEMLSLNSVVEKATPKT
jgi:large subunit ribosomal protein L10